MDRFRPFLRSETLVFLVLWLGLMLVGRTQLFRDPGTFWHTRVGQQILETGTFPIQDTFSFTRHGERWIAYHWLGEVGMAVVHDALGWDGLLLLLASALAALYAWVFWRLRRSGFHPLLAAVLVALVLAASVHNWHVRPHMATLFGMAITYGVLIDIDASRKPLAYLLGLIPLFVLWANVHGGVLGGWATLCLVGLGWLTAFVVRLPTPLRGYRDILILTSAIIGCGLALVVTPYGVEGIEFWLRILSLDLGRIIQEHGPLRWLEPTGLAVLSVAVVYLLTLAGILPDWPRMTWIVPLLWLWQAYERNRHAPLFAIVALLAVAEMMPWTRWAAYLKGRGSDLLRPEAVAESDWRAAVVPAVVVLFSLLVLGAGLRIPVVGRDWVREDPRHWPVGLLPKLVELKSHDNEAESDEAVRLFNDMLYGGYLIYHVPRLRVFIDDRCELYGQKFLEEYAEAESRHPEQIDEWSDQWQFHYALTRRGSRFDEYLQAQSRRWEKLDEDEAAVLFRRKAP
ncbi:MAG: hypothetical protein NZM31_13525 [Gemmatales bacterium]|nr:hypothetical protein [Gemmatales bacterium]MDW8388016.1 hypothetical protein [Gemmatales bacterium]